MNPEKTGGGFGLTGTPSTKAALEETGLGPRYHMRELFEHIGSQCEGSRSIRSLPGARGGPPGLVRIAS
jgi:hypothetical protein